MTSIGQTNNGNSGDSTDHQNPPPHNARFVSAHVLKLERISSYDPITLAFPDAITTLLYYVDRQAYSKFVDPNEATTSFTMQLLAKEYLVVEKSGNTVLCGYQQTPGTWDIQVAYDLRFATDVLWAIRRVTMSQIKCDNINVIQGLACGFARELLLGYIWAWDGQESQSIASRENNRINSSDDLSISGQASELRPSCLDAAEFGVRETICGLFENYNPAALDAFLDSTVERVEFTRLEQSNDEVLFVKRRGRRVFLGIANRSSRNTSWTVCYEIRSNGGWVPAGGIGERVDTGLRMKKGSRPDEEIIEELGKEVARFVVKHRSWETRPGIEIRMITS
ncbi:MAG: hypothetical protein MMC33_009604 [Icmadophila ericetorum]|nr:hypothetical protein [Icmadophila ericetorum]